jgi:hypothetical protein
MGTFLKIVGGLFLLFVVAVVALVVVSQNTDYAKYGKKQVALAQHISSHIGINRPASYYEWATEVEAEWQRVRADLVNNPMSEGIIKETDDFYAGLMKDIEADRQKAPDTPQIHPEQ